MTAPTERPTLVLGHRCAVCEAPAPEPSLHDEAMCYACAVSSLADAQADADRWFAERDALREQVKTLREAASMSLSVLLAVANGETDDYPERCRAAATCARAALASTETEVQP